jgi:hypothetical protein
VTLGYQTDDEARQALRDIVAEEGTVLTDG